VKPPASKVLLAVLVGAFTFALVEGGARLVVNLMPDEAAPLQLGDEGEWDELMQRLYRADDELFFRLRPNLTIDTTDNPRIFDVRTNALGLRGPEVAREKAAGVTRVLCVGDSCTFGSGAGAEDTWPAQLARLLKEQVVEARELPGLESEELGPFEVLNAGVPGYSSYQGRRYLETEGFDLDPDVVVFALGFNDSFQARPGPRRRFADGNYLSDREYAELDRQAPSWGVVRLWARLRGPVGGAADGAAEAEGEVDPRRARKRRVSPKEYWGNAMAVARQCRERGVRLVLVVWPIVAQTDPAGPLGRHTTLLTYQGLLREVVRKFAAPPMIEGGGQPDGGVQLVDLVPLVEGRPALFIDDVHMNPRGYRRVARAVMYGCFGIESPAWND
jgi:lysophospholipase L1-like esterase